MTLLMTIFATLCVNAEIAAESSPSMNIIIASAVSDERGTIELTGVAVTDCLTTDGVDPIVTASARHDTTGRPSAIQSNTATWQPSKQLLRIAIPRDDRREFRFFRGGMPLERQQAEELLKQPRRIVAVEEADSNTAGKSKALALFASDAIAVIVKRPFGWRYVPRPATPVVKQLPAVSQPLGPADFPPKPLKVKIAEARMDSLGTLSLTTSSVGLSYVGPSTSPAGVVAPAPQETPMWLPFTEVYRREITTEYGRDFKVWRKQKMLDRQDVSELLRQSRIVAVVEGIDAEAPLKLKTLSLFRDEVIVVGAAFVSPTKRE